MQLKIVEQQQQQLTNLFHAVPDSVLLCTKGTDSKGAKSIFANLKMNTFFGSDVVNFKNARIQKSRMKSVTKKKGDLESNFSTGPQQRRDPLRKPIFYRHEDKPDRGSQDAAQSDES